jgi:hypothetical protein
LIDKHAVDHGHQCHVKVRKVYQSTKDIHAVGMFLTFCDEDVVDCYIAVVKRNSMAAELAALVCVLKLVMKCQDVDIVVDLDVTAFCSRENDIDVSSCDTGQHVMWLQLLLCQKIWSDLL